MDADSKVDGIRTATADLTVEGRRLHLEMSVPAGKTSARRLLPLFRTLTDAVVGIAVEKARAEGREVSCRKGCGACCRQLVPVSETEAGRLRDLQSELPADRRDAIRARFDAATARLRASGMHDRLAGRARLREGAIVALALDYFALRIACPFLEDEACSIYDERPLACREYLVTSPARNCAAPTPTTVKLVAIPIHVSRLTRDLDAGNGQNRWLPLVLALDWADHHPEAAPLKTGIELLQELFRRLTGRTVPDPPG